MPSNAQDDRGMGGAHALERARKREIAGYLNAASFPIDMPDGPPPTPAGSSDPVLNALVQLGALRLDCDRAFVSLIDDENQYICAEMTKTLRLGSQEPAASDGLFLGCCKLPMDYGVCPLAMKTFMDTDGTMEQHGPDVIANSSRYIITDFRRTDIYRKKPYVTGYPYMVSYLEVPLTSPLGYVLGSYCVVDNKLREFNDNETVAIMSEMSNSIMRHLDSSLSNKRHARAENLITGLSGYADRRASLTPQISDTQSKYHRSGEPSRPMLEDCMQSTESVTPSPDVARMNEEQQILRHSKIVPSMDTTQDDTLDEAAASANAQKSDWQHYMANHLSLLQEAAQTTREALNLDGLMFVDAVASQSYDASESRSTQFSPMSPMSPTSPLAGEVWNARSGLYAHAVSQVLAKSLRENQASEESQAPCRDLRAHVIQNLIERFPSGSIFSADRDGPIADAYGPGVKIDPRRDHASSVEHSDEFDLFQCLPQAAYILFVPLWHFQRECWFTAMIGWTTDVNQAMNSMDVNLLAAFGNSVISKIAFTEASTMSRIKSDFISSISHELRSPLHAIMATSELLREQLSGDSELSMVDMIDSCGTTLLDTFSNLLDHARINKTLVPYDRSDNDQQESQIESEVTNPYSTVNLGRLVEDVVAIVTLGHDTFSLMQRAPERRTSDLQVSRHRNGTVASSPVQVIVNIDTAVDCSIQTDMAAWKRIVMNLTGNALKYTKAGVIEIVLSRNSIPSDDGQTNCQVHLEIRDTGIGMSPEYLRYHLFESFSQENALAPGTGLGLSIVQQLVRGLGGKITVDSEKGVGTLIKVNVPAKLVATQISETEQSKASSSTPDTLRGTTICLISAANSSKSSVPPANSKEEHRQAVLYKNLCAFSEAIGMTVLFAPVGSDLPSAHFYFMDAHVSEELPLAHQLIVSYPRSLSSTTSALDKTRSVICIGNPITPDTFRKALVKAQAMTAQATTPAQVDYPKATQVLNVDNRLASIVDETNNGQADAMEIATPDLRATQLRVLLVDDNAINLKLLIKLMDKFNHKFETAMDGSQALERFTDAMTTPGKTFDVIFMDLSMPVMDGFEATRRIRQAEEAAGVPACEIHALTGLGSESAQVKAAGAGFDKFLKKPVKMKEIAEILKAMEESKRTKST